MSTKFRFLPLIVACLLFAGCSTISVSAPDGYSASYTRIGNQDISGLRFEKGESGLYRLTLDKQSSDSDVLSLIRQLVAQ
jgi:hypothetical protein